MEIKYALHLLQRNIDLFCSGVSEVNEKFGSFLAWSVLSVRWSTDEEPLKEQISSFVIHSRRAWSELVTNLLEFLVNINHCVRYCEEKWVNSEGKKLLCDIHDIVESVIECPLVLYEKGERVVTIAENMVFCGDWELYFRGNFRGALAEFLAAYERLQVAATKLHQISLKIKCLQ